MEKIVNHDIHFSFLLSQGNQHFQALLLKYVQQFHSAVHTIKNTNVEIDPEIEINTIKKKLLSYLKIDKYGEALHHGKIGIHKQVRVLRENVSEILGEYRLLDTSPVLTSLKFLELTIIQDLQYLKRENGRERKEYDEITNYMQDRFASWFIEFIILDTKIRNAPITELIQNAKQEIPNLSTTYKEAILYIVERYNTATHKGKLYHEQIEMEILEELGVVE